MIAALFVQTGGCYFGLEGAEQFDAIGCELSPEYAAIAERRVREHAGLFADVAIDERQDEAA